MSQHINLLVGEAGKVRYGVLPAALLVLAAVLGMLGVAGLQYWQTRQLQAELGERERAVAARAAVLDGLRARVRVAEGAADGARLARARAAEALAAHLRNNPPGRAEGPAGMLAALARTDPGRAWLTAVSIGSGGLRLEGRALEPTAVLDYAAALEARFADTGVVFRTVELNGNAPGQGVGFRLH